MLIAALVFTVYINAELQKYHATKIQESELMSFQNRIDDVGEYLPIIGTSEDKVDQFIHLENKADKYYSMALKNTYVFVVIVVLFMLVNTFYYRNHEEYRRVYGMTFVFCAMAFLYLGLNSPLIEVEAFNKDLTIDLYVTSHTFEGYMYYMYMNKSILKLIGVLYLGGNFVVAIALLMFSVVFPVIKLISTLLVFLTPNARYSNVFIKVINALGKWSMADVMVAGIFLAVFSFANMDVAIETGSKTLVGLHYFLAFVVLSIISGIYLKKYVKFRAEEKEKYEQSLSQ